MCGEVKVVYFYTKFLVLTDGMAENQPISFGNTSAIGNSPVFVYLLKARSRRFWTAFTLQKRISLVISRFLPNFQAFVANLRVIPDGERPKYDSRDIQGFKDPRGPC